MTGILAYKSLLNLMVLGMKNSLCFYHLVPFCHTFFEVLKLLRGMKMYQKLPEEEE